MIDYLILPLEEYRLPIWQAWDKRKIPCPHNPNGWMAHHHKLLAEKCLESYDENGLDLRENP